MVVIGKKITSYHESCLYFPLKKYFKTDFVLEQFKRQLVSNRMNKEVPGREKFRKMIACQNITVRS